MRSSLAKPLPGIKEEEVVRQTPEQLQCGEAFADAKVFDQKRSVSGAGGAQ